MYGTFQATGKGDTHNINGQPVEITEILGNSVTVKLPSGRKAHLPLKNLTNIAADLTFTEDGVEVVEHESEEVEEVEEVEE